MARLPTPGSDDGNWGEILNDFLSVEHNADGSLKKAADITAAQQTADSAISALNTKADLVSGKIPISQLASGTPDGTKFIRDDGTLQAVESSPPLPTYKEREGEIVYAAARSSTGSVVCLRFDDNYDVDHDWLMPLLTERKLVAGFAVINSSIDTGARMTRAQIYDLQRLGMEIMHHSRTHGDPPASWSEFVDETATAAAEQRNHATQPFYCDAFAQPGTWGADDPAASAWYFDSPAKFTPEVEQLFRQNYMAMGGYIDDRHFGSAGMPKRLRYGSSYNAATEMSLTSLQQRIDALIARGGVMTILGHSYQFGAAGKMSQADFVSVLDYIADKRDAGQLEVMTPTAAYYAMRGELLNLLRDPTMQNGAFSAPYWTAIGSPVFLDTGGENGGPAAQVSGGSANYFQQDIMADSLRSYEITVRAKAASAGTPATNARLIVTEFPPSGTGDQLSSGRDTQALPTDGSWATVRFTYGASPLCSQGNQTYGFHRIVFRNQGLTDVVYDLESLKVVQR